MHLQRKSKIFNKKNKFLSWIFWWRVDDNELTKQIKEYKKLGLFHSARKISALLFFFSALATASIVLALDLNRYTLIDALLMFLLGIFMYLGHRWAIIGAMIYWTYTKIYLTFPNPTGIQADFIISLVWWLAYMHFFYLAFKVEQERRKK